MCKHPPRSHSKLASFPGAEGPSPCLHTTSSGHTHVTRWNLPAAKGSLRCHLSFLPQGALTSQAWSQQRRQE